MGKVAVAGDGAGVCNEGQERDEARSEVEKEAETGRDRDHDGGKREADAVDGEDLQPLLEVVAVGAEDEPFVGEKGDGDGDGKRGVVGDGGDGGAMKFGKEELDREDKDVRQGNGEDGVEAADHEEADDLAGGEGAAEGGEWAVRFGVGWGAVSYEGGLLGGSHCSYFRLV